MGGSWAVLLITLRAAGSVMVSLSVQIGDDRARFITGVCQVVDSWELR